MLLLLGFIKKDRMKKLIVVITLCSVLISCSIRSSQKDDSDKKVFLELILASTKDETMAQINQLIKDGRIQKLKSSVMNKEYYEYPFFIKKREYVSYFFIHFNTTGQLLESIEIEVQDPFRQLRVDDIYKLMSKKYGSSNDSTFAYHNFNLKDPYKSYYWEFDDVKISVERKNYTSFGFTNDYSNYFKITYEDVSDWNEQMINKSRKIEEGQNKTEEDL